MILAGSHGEPHTMTDRVIHPTLKFIRAAYLIELCLIVAAFIVQKTVIEQGPWWIPLVLLILPLWTLFRHIRRLSVKLSLTGDKLRFETGILSKSTRTIQLAKVQDVRVDQSLAQRIFGVGTIAIETAGEHSRLSVDDIDRPQIVADEIMKRSEEAASSQRTI
jgi:uncharacterized membrane protein YdbT with pleckstrin-like domain